MKLRKISFTFIIVGLLTIWGCDAFLDIPTSPQLIESKNLIATESAVQSAVDGVFADLRNSNPRLINGAVSIYAGLASDELRPTSIHPIYDPFHDNVLMPDNNFAFSSLWSAGYRNIFRCNTLLAELRSDVALPQAVSDRFIGELLVARGVQYMYLAGLYGDVPLVLTPDYTVNAVMGRTSHTDILLHVASDLAEARERMPFGDGQLQKTRPTYWAATALLARIKLYLGKYTEAIELASDVIDGPFILHPTLKGIFLIGGVETIWEIAHPASTGNTPDGGAFIPSSPTRLPLVALTEAVTSLFEPQDLRRTHWIGTTLVGSEPVFYPFKYTYLQSGETNEYTVVLRLAEQYLIRAEAYLATDRQGLARKDLNTIRERAEASPLDTDLYGDALWDMLRAERQRELFSEWGHRWFDLRRWGIIDTVMVRTKPAWEPYMALFPIPDSQLLYNYSLTQNPGY